MSEEGWTYAKRYAGRYLTTAATLLVVFGIAMIVLPLLPASSPEQRGENLWIWIPSGLALIVVGTLWTIRRVRRHGFKGHPPVGPEM
jgi:hypothetical protein